MEKRSMKGKKSKDSSKTDRSHKWWESLGMAYEGQEAIKKNKKKKKDAMKELFGDKKKKN